MQTTSDLVTNESVSTNLKPRPRFTPEERKAILERYHARSATEKQLDFAAREGISKAALGKWLTQERRRKAATPKAVKFRELELPLSKSSWAVELSSPRQWTLRLAQVPSGAVLQQLLSALPC